MAELLANVKDVGKVKDDIKNRIDQITTFPEDAEEPRIEELLLKRHVINVAVYGDAPEATLRETARRVKDDLLAMDGVSQASFLGVRDYEIGIEISEAALRRYGLTLDRVADVVRRNSTNVPGGSVRTPEQQIKIETRGRRYRGLDFGKMVHVEPLQIDDQDPLRAELETFVDCVRTGKRPPVSVQDGVAAVRLAEQITDAVKSHRWDGEAGERVGLEADIFGQAVQKK